MSERHIKAAKLREQGLSYSVIAARLGVSHHTIYRWLNPEYAERSRERARGWKERNHERKRAYDRAYDATHKGTCSSCGGEMDRTHDGGICQACRSDEADRIARQAEQLWAEGKTMREIYEAWGWSRGHLSVMLDRWRGQGYDFPYRYKGAVNGTKYPRLQKTSD